MSISNAGFDIRKLYKNIKDVNWETQNVFYNTVCFSLNCKIDVEFSIDIWNLYRDKLPYFKDWEIKEHNKGNKLVPKGYDGYFSADIMTGWWNPFKYFVGFTGGERENICRMMLFDKIPEDKDTTKLLGWFQTLNKNIQKEHMESFLGFLEVVYTVGNVIPSPINRNYGNKLDAWDAKLSVIKDSFKGNKLTELAWNQYIYSCYGGTSYDKKFDNENFNIFIEKNYLEMYWDNKKKEIKFFWTDKNNQGQHIPQTLDDWATYFKNATECIEERNKSIQDEIEK